MNEQDHFRIEAAEQFGFDPVGDDESPTWSCTAAQIVAFAKACERKGRAEVATEARERANMHRKVAGVCSGTAATVLESLAGRLELQNAATDAELVPILAAEEVRYMTSRGYVRGPENGPPGTRWVKPRVSTGNPALDVALRFALAWFDSLTPEEQAAHRRAQAAFASRPDNMD